MSNAYIGDLHLGARSNSQLFRNFIHDEIKRMLSEMSDHGVGDIYQLGDFFNATTIHTNDIIFVQWLDDFLYKNSMTMHVLSGNHGQVYETKNFHNSTIALMGMKNINVYYEVCRNTSNGVDHLIIPWLHKENGDQAIKEIKKGGDICLGHFETVGFSFNSSSKVCTEGVKPKIFSNFNSVLSGHFHTRSEIGNIRYIGAPYHLTWIDQPDGDNRGWEDQRFKLHKTKNSLFTKLTYGIDDIMPDNITGKYVLLNVMSKDDVYDTYVQTIRDLKPYNFDIVDNTIIEYDVQSNNKVELDIDEVEMIESLELNLDANKVAEYLNEMRVES